MHHTITKPLWQAEAALNAAKADHKKIPGKIRLGDLNPGRQVLDTETKLIRTGIRLDPLPTQAKTNAIAELCDHLTATEARYPGTALTLRYEIKRNQPAEL